MGSKLLFTAAGMSTLFEDLAASTETQTAYKNVVTAVGHRYKEYGLRINMVKKGEGASERTKYGELRESLRLRRFGS
jgi:hypothetical protein